MNEILKLNVEVSIFHSEQFGNKFNNSSKINHKKEFEIKHEFQFNVWYEEVRNTVINILTCDIELYMSWINKNIFSEICGAFTDYVLIKGKGYVSERIKTILGGDWGFVIGIIAPIYL